MPKRKNVRGMGRGGSYGGRGQNPMAMMQTLFRAMTRGGYRGGYRGGRGAGFGRGRGRGGGPGPDGAAAPG